MKTLFFFLSLACLQANAGPTAPSKPKSFLAETPTTLGDTTRSAQAALVDQNGNTLSGGVESRHADSPCKHGERAKDGLTASAHSLVRPNNASGSSVPPAQFISPGDLYVRLIEQRRVKWKEPTRKDLWTKH